MKLIKSIDKLLKNLFEGKSKKENALKMVEEEAKNKGGGLKQLNENNIGQQPLSVVLPHLKMVAETYNLKLSSASDFKIAKVILTSWLSKQNSNTYATV